MINPKKKKDSILNIILFFSLVITFLVVGFLIFNKPVTVNYSRPIYKTEIEIMDMYESVLVAKGMIKITVR